MQDFHAELYVWGQEVRQQSQERLETVKKDIEHPHFQARIPFIKDQELYFVWNKEDSKYQAKDDADSKHILGLLQNPNSTEFKVGARKEPTRASPAGLSTKDLLKAEANNPGKQNSWGPPPKKTSRTPYHHRW